MNTFSLFIDQRKYEILLASLLILLFGDSYVAPGYESLYMIILPLQAFLVGFTVFYKTIQLRIILGIVCGLRIIFTILEMYGLDLHVVGAVLFCIYFIVISFTVFRKILIVKTVTAEMISAAICGLILLGLMASIMYITVEENIPGSFSNIHDTLKDLTYFSFITLLTIGYGDIVPQTLLAKRMVILNGLAGHFYTVFVTAIIIGKYLTRSEETEEEAV